MSSRKGMAAKAASGPAATRSTPPAAKRSDARFAALRAELARRGYQLHAVNFNGATTYLVARWDRSRDLRDLTAVEQFLVQIGGAP